MVVAHLVPFAEGDERGHTDAEAGQRTEQRDAHSAGLEDDSGGARAGRRRGEGRVQPYGLLGVGRTQALGPQQPHPVAPAGGQQLRRLDAVESGGDGDQGLDPEVAALLGDIGHGGGGQDREAGYVGQLRDRRVARRAVNGLGVRVDGGGPSSEAVRPDVAQQRAADR